MMFPKPVKQERPRKPLRRTRMRPSARGTKHSRRERHFGYMLFVKHRCCAVLYMKGVETLCTYDEDGNVEAAHVGPRVGPRASDLDTIPLCSLHHRIDGWDTYSGPFKGWTREQRRAWAEKEIAVVRACWELLSPEARDNWNARAGR